MLPRRASPRPSASPLAALRPGAVAVAAASGLAAASLLHLGLPAPVYRAVAVVAPDAGGAKGAGDPNLLADFARSRAVLRFAAAELISKGALAPEPGPLERLGLVRLDAEADRAARLTEQLAAALHVAPAGDTLLIGAEAPDPARAARITGAVAAAFVAKRGEAVVGQQRTREAELASRIAAAQADAAAARKRFVAAGGADAGVLRARAAAAAEVTTAQERVTRLRAVLASGSPPVADDASAPQAITDQQAAYLDLKGKLAQALETLGERHTTVITLRDSIRRAGADLTAAWTRQLRGAEADAEAARTREAALGRTDPAGDARKQAALDEARRAKEAADGALLRAEAELDFLPDQQFFSLRAPAVVPTRAAAGWFPLARGAASLLAGLLAFALAVAVPRGIARLRRLVAGPPAGPEARRVAPVLDAPPAPAVPAPVWSAPLRTAPAPDAPPSDRPGAGVDFTPRAVAPVAAPPRAMLASAAAAEDDDEDMLFFRDAPPADAASDPDEEVYDAASEPDVEFAGEEPPTEEQDASSPDEEMPADLEDLAVATEAERDAVRDLQAAFEAVLAGLAGVRPGHGPIPAVMVAANGSTDATAEVALALGEVAAGAGLRVLVVEAPRDRPALAAFAEDEDRPALVGMRDGLRIVLGADGVEGLFLAPLFDGRAGLVAALARNAGAPVIEDVAATFDLLVIDGGEAATAAAAGWSADRYLCVGGDASLGEVERFLRALAIPSTTFAGTVADATFVPPPARPGLRHVAVRGRSAATRPPSFGTAAAA